MQQWVDEVSRNLEGRGASEGVGSGIETSGGGLGAHRVATSRSGLEDCAQLKLISVGLLAPPAAVMVAMR